jgi:hypothetical protein
MKKTITLLLFFVSCTFFSQDVIFHESKISPLSTEHNFPIEQLSASFNSPPQKNTEPELRSFQFSLGAGYNLNGNMMMSFHFLPQFNKIFYASLGGDLYFAYQHSKTAFAFNIIPYICVNPSSEHIILLGAGPYYMMSEKGIYPVISMRTVFNHSSPVSPGFEFKYPLLFGVGFLPLPQFYISINFKLH